MLLLCLQTTIIQSIKKIKQTIPLNIIESSCGFECGNNQYKSKAEININQGATNKQTIEETETYLVNAKKINQIANAIKRMYGLKAPRHPPVVATAFPPMCLFA
jgi:hypothetical protein